MLATTLTKEVFLKAVACPTGGWFLRNVPGEPPSPGEQLRMLGGQEVHQRARGLFPDGVFAASSQQPKALVTGHSKEILFEAAFSDDGYSARDDILQRRKAGFHFLEGPLAPQRKDAGNSQRP